MVSASDWEDNPYIIGRPIYEPELFFGREDLFNFIHDNLNKRAQVILLHGQRRIGKSSVLSQIPNFIKLEQFLFVPLSLEGKSQKPLSEVLHELGRDIIDYLELSQRQVLLPTKTDLAEDAQLFFNNFLPQIYQVIKGKNLVLLLDEFDVLGDSEEDSAVSHFFPCLQSVVYWHKELYIIPVVGRQLDDMPNLLSLFRQAPHREIGLLDRHSAERLIVKPAAGILRYETDAIDAILQLSAGHPYFTQVVCFALFSQARDEQRWLVNRQDVENIIDSAIEIGEAGLAWFRDGLPIAERVVFSAAAQAQQQTNAVVKGEPLTHLVQCGVVLTEPFHTAEERLLEWGFFKQLGTSGLPELYYLNNYKVTVELVRRWLIKRYPLRREIWELAKLDSQSDRIYQQATKLYQNNHIENALKLYEQVLQINPNHFDALFRLAEVCIDVKDFDAAVELYARAYKVDPIRNKEGFVQALLSYGQELMEQDRFEAAKEQFRQALILQPDNIVIQAALVAAQEETKISRSGERFVITNGKYVEKVSDAIIISHPINIGEQSIYINQGIDLGEVTVTDATYLVNNSIAQLQTLDVPEAMRLANLLQQLQTEIVTNRELEPEDKAEALEQVIALAEAGKYPEEGRMRRIARTSLKILIGTLAGLPSSATLVRTANQLLPAISKLLNLNL
ncbi:tetratricopeptide repeat protein [Tolypothrix sp. FACHB-123]|uniref:tetratricopeptide repeat protein n=1 Tax=Tolypothrix sp. FACHB-123 TaxID=2692868 RepID=UPI001682EA0D|nr:ATP-binding protein [Tolypothrix sp. FACHB-123]MBD2358795.1 tetratricopeptide repeat protein [Tolypothrix sp. FACHB-123]